MNSGATSRRVYHDLKRHLLAARYRPGDRLEPVHLGELLNSSATPVRDALHLLTGEGLVETAASEGFHVPRIDAPALEDLYHWTNDVLSLVARSITDAIQAPVEGDYPDAVARLFSSVAARSPNMEHRRAINGLNDRLHPIRRAEAQVIPDWRSELSNLAADVTSSRRSALAALGRYHRRRVRLAAEIVRHRYRLD